jgi:hypothetical protein
MLEQDEASDLGQTIWPFPSSRTRILTDPVAQGCEDQAVRAPGGRDPSSVDEHDLPRAPNAHDRFRAAYGLTPGEIRLMWDTAPPRMPIPRPALI